MDNDPVVDYATHSFVDAANDVLAYGHDGGLIEAGQFLEQLPASGNDEADDGCRDTASAIWALVQTPDMARNSPWRMPTLETDPEPVLALAKRLRAEGRVQGLALAVTTAREYHDEQVDRYADLDEAYRKAVESAARLLVEHFGIDPDPGWTPARREQAAT